jgi:hypothetical protein
MLTLTLLIGCGDDAGPRDGGAEVADLSGADLTRAGDDLTMRDEPAPRDLQMTYADVTPHALDEAAMMGTPVRLRGVVVTTPALGAPVTRTGGPAAEHFCRYSLWVQDPACAAPPCGILLRTESAPQATAPAACPTDAAATLLGALAPGDNVDVEGIAGYHDASDSGGGGATTREHYVAVDRTAAAAGARRSIADVIVSDAATLAAFARFSTGASQSWQRYEGTRVRLAPASGYVVAANGAGWVTTPNATPFSPLFVPSPAAGTQLTSAAGVASPGFGGVMFPVRADDLVLAP